MRRISSRATFFYKRVFPAIWFGFLLVFAAAPFVFPSSGQASSLPFFLAPALMVVLGYFLMRKLVFDLVDEVWDTGDALLVRNAKREDRIKLSDIKNVGYSPLMNPPRVTLSLRTPSIFGDSVSFSAPVRFLPFSPSPVINELIERIDEQRRKTRN
jgi:hypothetical protein